MSTPAGPKAVFEAAPLSGFAPLTVTFVNSSTNAVSYVWDWGDGLTGTQISPVHPYTLPGVYTVSLTANGPNGSDTLTKPNYISVTQPGPIVWVQAVDAQAAEEGLDPGVFTIHRTLVTTEALKVDYILVGTAEMGADYEPVSTTVMIPPDQSIVTVTITPVDDALVEPRETVQLRLESSDAYSQSYHSKQFLTEAMVTIADNEPNLPPQTFGITLTVSKNHSGTLNLETCGVYDPNQDELVFDLEQLPNHGSASVNGYSLAYTPETDYVGEDWLTYHVEDGRSDPVTGTVLIRVVESVVNKAPIAHGRAFITRGDVPVSVDLRTLASDPEGGPLTFRIQQRAGRGFSYLQGTSLIYEPTLALTQTDTVV
jgi:PKD repeat protein